MDHREAGRYWEGNAREWTLLARQGWDVYRDALNTPAFLDLLPDVAGKTGLDVGCGEGHNTRRIAERGARMFGIDIAPTFVRLAAECKDHGVRYAAASMLELPFSSGQFDFVTACMCLMDVPEQPLALREIYRVLRSGGFLQFSIVHPCFFPPHRKLLRTPGGNAYAVEVGRYYDKVDGQIERWLFGSAPEEIKAGMKPFEIPIFHRTLSEWLNSILEAGFDLEKVAEPKATDEMVRRFPAIQDTQAIAYTLHARCRKD